MHKYTLKSTSCKSGMQTFQCSCGKAKKNRCKKGHDYRQFKEGLYTAEKCKNCGQVKKKYLSKEIPTYWDSTISKALKTAKARSNLPGYVFITDPHWEKNAGQSPAIVNYVTRQMGYSYTVCGGDVVTGSHDAKQDALKEIKEFYDKISVPILSVRGNHDDNSNGNSNAAAFLSSSDINRLMYAHNPPGTHMSHGGDCAYIDDSAHRVRYITFYYDETAPVSADVIDSIDQRVTELDANKNNEPE